MDVHLKFAQEVPLELYPIDGAVHRVGRSKETAWECRDAMWTMVITGIDPDPAQAGRLTEWAQSYWEEIHPHNKGGAYINFMMDEAPACIRATYGDNYDRLAAIKKKYDPQNLFWVNQNIPPG